MTDTKRIVSGMRTTGQLHLGHLHGVINNWLELQDKYQCFLFAADLHALTTNYANPGDLQEIALQTVIEWIACGVDPQKATIFIQSHVAQHAELHLLLSMITPLGWLERVPTYKEQQQKLKDKDLSNYGFLGYPLLQSADILLYGADYVPVGKDQESHIELCREIARRFNFIYAKNKDKAILSEPEALFTKITKMPGLDGQKMSKSYGNTIFLRDEDKEITRKIKAMPTDPARVRRTDPGTPEKCPVWDLHKIYSDKKTCEWVQEGCTTAGIGCIDCKKPIIDAIISEVTPIRNKIAELNEDKQVIKNIVKEGANKARVVAQETLREVKKVMELL